MAKRSLRFFNRPADEHGDPYTPEQIAELLAVGKLQTSDRFWAEGSSESISAEEAARSSLEHIQPDVFISHSSRNKDLAKDLVAALEKSGICCWIDHQNLTPGYRWSGQLKLAIESCKALLLLESTHSNLSPEVQTEVAIARKRRIPILPVRLEKVKRTDQMDYLLQGYHWIDATEPPFKRHFSKIAEGVRKAIGAAAPLPDEDTETESLYVGPYRLLDRLGEGGMGEVYRAEQRSPIRRLVALKRIKPGLDSKEVLARFESERQALARMDHPHIARVLDAGKDELGRPYFAMEYVPGKPITQFADEHKLSLEKRLELFQEVCSAIAHAHTKAIIHRDIKPSNVLAAMVDDRPQVKVIDFGIAKALTADRLTDYSSATQPGLAIGTLESMSPEQASGSLDIDTRTDVYALGALLYELLCGCKPFEGGPKQGGGEAELRRLIHEVDPPRPSVLFSKPTAAQTQAAAARDTKPESLARMLRRELEWIPLKALRKERSRRYQSAAELALDIQNYLDDKPLLAGPETMSYRFRKSLHRHRGAVVSGLLMTALASIGGFGYVSGIRQEQVRTEAALEAVKQEQARTQQALLEAETQRQLAIDNSTLATKRLDEKRIALDNMLEAFSDEQLQRQPGSQPVRKLFLQRGLEQYQQLLSEQSSDLSTMLKISDCLRELSQVSKEMGLSEESLDRLEEATRVCRTALEERPDAADLKAALANALFSQAQTLFSLGKLNECQPAITECIEILQGLLEQTPDDVQLSMQLGAAQVRLASLTDDEAIRTSLYEEAITRLRESVKTQPDDVDCLVELARGLMNSARDLPTAEQRIARNEEAQSLLKRALQLAPSSESGIYLAEFLTTNLVRELSQLGRNKEAEALLAEQISATRNFTSENPSVLNGLRALGNLLALQASHFSNLGRQQDALKSQAEAILTTEMVSQRSPDDPKANLDLIWCKLRLAELEKRRPETPENISLFRQTAGQLLAGMKRFSGRDDYLTQWLNLQSQLLPSETLASKSLLSLSDFGSDIRQLENILADFEIDDSDTAVAYCSLLSDWLDRLPDELATAPPLSLLQGCQARVKAVATQNQKAAIQLFLLRTSVARFLQRAKRYQEAIELRRQLLHEVGNLDWRGTAVMFRPELFAWFHLAPLAECLRQTDQQREEFEVLNQYFREAAAFFVKSPAHSLSTEAPTYSDDSLRELRRQFDEQVASRELLNYPLVDVRIGEGQSRRWLNLQVSDSWSLIELQCQFARDSRVAEVDNAYSLRVLREIYEGLLDVPEGFRTAVASIESWAEKSLPLADKIRSARQAYLADRGSPELGLNLCDTIVRNVRQVSDSAEEQTLAMGLLEEADRTLATLRPGNSEQEQLRSILSAEVLYQRARLSEKKADMLPQVQQWLLEAWEALPAQAPGELKCRILAALGTHSRGGERVTFLCHAIAAGELGAIEQVCQQITPLSPELHLFLPEDIREGLEVSPPTDPADFRNRLRELCVAYSQKFVAAESSAATEPESAADELVNAAPEAPVSELQQKVDEVLDRTWGAYLRRTIVLLYGKMDNGNPCWLFAAVRASRYEEFQQAYQAGQIDLEQFEPWGELIISGDGRFPSRRVVDQVAQMYQVDPAQLAKSFGLETQDRLTESAESIEEGEPLEESPVEVAPREDKPERSLSWPDFLVLADDKIRELLPYRLAYFSENGSLGDLIQTAELADRFQEFKLAAEAFLHAADRMEALGNTSDVNRTELASAWDVQSLRRAAIESLKREVAKPDFIDFATLAADETFQSLRQNPEFRALFRLK